MCFGLFGWLVNVDGDLMRSLGPFLGNRLVLVMFLVTG